MLQMHQRILDFRQAALEVLFSEVSGENFGRWRRAGVTVDIQHFPKYMRNLETNCHEWKCQNYQVPTAAGVCDDVYDWCCHQGSYECLGSKSPPVTMLESKGCWYQDNFSDLCCPLWSWCCLPELLPCFCLPHQSQPESRSVLMSKTWVAT